VGRELTRQSVAIFFDMRDKPAPTLIGGLKVICYTPIDGRHRFTAQTRQVVGDQLMGSMSGLAICRSDEGKGFYLFGCDADWSSVTDTWHQSLDEAKNQAEWEYEGVNQTWIYLA
jgi:hypothetical protein